MSDYTPSGNPVDGTTGDASEIRNEFALIETAIATKHDSSDIGSVVQAWSANLDEYAAVNPTAAGLALLDDADASAQRTTLGLAIGTNVQAWSSNLDEYAAVNPTAAGLALLDDADAAAQRTTLGLGTLATQSGTFSGTSSGTNTGDNAVNSLYSGLVSNATHTGDVTGSTALTIANDAVTYAKMQNVSATDKLLGRSTAGAGDVEEITCTAAGRALLDDADASAQRTTLGLATAAKTDAAQTFTAPQRGTITTDNDGSFDLNATNNFKCTTAGALALTFTNIASAAGQSGNIVFINGSNHAITQAANTKIASGTLAAISVTGTYLLGYFCDGTDVYVAATGATT